MPPSMFNARTLQAQEMLERYLAFFPQEAPGLQHLKAQLNGEGDIFARSNMRGHFTASGLVLNANLTKVLMIHHVIYDQMFPPGGHVEGLEDESLWQACCREVMEETGLQVMGQLAVFERAGVPLDIDTHPIPANPTKAEGDHWHHDVTFLAIAPVDIELKPQLAEVEKAIWMPREEFAQLAPTRVRRLAQKLDHWLPLPPKAPRPR